MKIFKYPLIILFALSLFLSGCFLPENFTAKVTVHKDGSYIFAYDGTLVYALALSAAAEGKLTDKDEKKFSAEAEKMKRMVMLRTNMALMDLKTKRSELQELTALYDKQQYDPTPPSRDKKRSKERIGYGGRDPAPENANQEIHINVI